MSCINRSFARLPLHIFTDLLTSDDEYSRKYRTNPKELRQALTNKLLQNNYLTNSAADAQNATTIGHFIQLSIPSLVQIFNPLLNLSECHTLFSRICRVCSAQPQSALTLLKKQMRPIPTNIQALDLKLKGGFQMGVLSEIVGRTGVGKTQLAMQLCINSAILMKYGSICIDTEGKFSIGRLRDMTQERVKINYQDIITTNADFLKLTTQILDQVIIQSARTTEDLIFLVHQLEETILLHNTSNPTNPIKLIVIDSIAAPMQREFDTLSSTTRANKVIELAQHLKQIAYDCECAVIIVNQVISSDSIPALGISWSHCISCRLLLEEEAHTRYAKIEKSHVSGFAKVAFFIDSSGLNEI